MSASLDRPFSFPEELLKVLQELLPIKASSLYALDSLGESLALLHQQGLDYLAFESFELHLETLAGSALKTKGPIVEEDVSSSPGYRDKDIIVKANLRGMVALRIEVPTPAHIHASLASDLVLCAYPDSPSDLMRVASSLEDASTEIGLLFGFALAQKQLLLRAKIVEKAAISRDLNSCLHRSLRLLCEELDIEAGSIFLYDERSRLLRAHASTGLVGDRHLQDVIYREGDGSDTWRTFETESFVQYHHLDKKPSLGRFVESVGSSRGAFLAAPIYHPARSGQHSRRRVIGVARLLNKSSAFAGRRDLINFTWEDSVVISFFCDMLGIIVHHMRSRERRVEYFEKIMHGTLSNILAVRKNLDMLERRGMAQPPHLQYTISNSITFLDDIKSQIDRLSDDSSKELETTKVQLAGEVLIKTATYALRLAEADEVEHVEITNLKASGFFDIPPVIGNVNALLTVFRNLVENAVKYMGDDTPSRVNISFLYEVHRDCVKILIMDSGIGIPPEDRDFIFEEGYRAENAIQKRPSSTGVGLTQARALMIAMDGDLCLETREGRPVFVVSIPRWEPR